MAQSAWVRGHAQGWGSGKGGGTVCLKPLSLTCPTGGNMNRTSIKTLGFALAAALPCWPARSSRQRQPDHQLQVPWPGPGRQQGQGRQARAARGFDYTFGDSGFTWATGIPAWTGSPAIRWRWISTAATNSRPVRVDLDVGALTYAYPGNSLGNTTELYGAATTYGPFTAKYSHTVSQRLFRLCRPQAGHGPQGQTPVT